MNICVMRYSTKSKSWMYIKIFCFFMMNSSIRLHIPRYKQDFGPAFFAIRVKKPGKPYPLCLNFRHRGGISVHRKGRIFPDIMRA